MVETGPNGSTVVDGIVAHGIVGAQQDRRQEGAAGDRRIGIGIAGDDARAGCLELGDLRRGRRRAG